MRKLNYTPKFNLSIKYLSMIMSKDELRALLRRYKQAKIDYWKERIEKAGRG